MKYFEIMFASSAVAALVSAITSLFISKYLKKYEYKLEYHKAILSKRLNAYQFIENQIAILKKVILDENDKHPYHYIFNDRSLIYKFENELSKAMEQGIWIDKKTLDVLEKFNNLFFNINNKVRDKNSLECIKIGKLYYEKISDYRFELENYLKNGLYNLHDVRKIFKIKDKKNKTKIIYRE